MEAHKKSRSSGKLLAAYSTNVMDIMKEEIVDAKRQPSRDVCMRIYNRIFNVIAESVSHYVKDDKALIKNEAVNLVAQMLYDSVELSEGSDERLDPTIFTERAKLSKLDRNELAIFGVGFHGSPFAAPFIMELKRRGN